MPSVEVRFLGDWHDFKANETHIIRSKSEAWFVERDGVTSLKINCNDRGDHAGINLNPRLGLSLEILESGSDQVKFDSEFSELRPGDLVRIVDGPRLIAEISHQPKTKLSDIAKDLMLRLIRRR